MTTPPPLSEGATKMLLFRDKLQIIIEDANCISAAGKTTPDVCSRYNTGDLTLLPGPLWSGVVVHVRVAIMDKIKLLHPFNCVQINY